MMDRPTERDSGGNGVCGASCRCSLEGCAECEYRHKINDKLAAYEDAAPLEKVREWAGAEKAANRREKAEYIFCEEVTVTFQECDGAFTFDDPECEPSSACVIKCASCGWHMYGDGWWGGDNFQKSEQIPRFCAHCGREFGEEAQAALPEK